MPDKEETSNLVKSRPSELGTLLGGAIVGLLVAYRLIPEATAPNWIIVIAALPTVITSVVVFFTKK